MQDAFAHCEALVRAADKDRFLAALFAPAEHRGALFALYAFNLEVARVREAIREPLAGEIRLQWWSDLIGGEGRGEVEAHPVAAAMRATIVRYRLPEEPFKALIDARRFDLYDEPMATLADLEAYAAGASSSLIALAARVLAHVPDKARPALDARKPDISDLPSRVSERGHTRVRGQESAFRAGHAQTQEGGGDPDVGAIARHGGIAHAIAGLLKAFPVHAARGQLYVPIEVLERHGADPKGPAGGRGTPELRAALAEMRLHARRHLADARGLLAAVPGAVMPALLPVALAGPTLERMERRGYDPFVPVEIAPWRRQWLIWRAARRPARIFG
jgi:phytoene synthase